VQWDHIGIVTQEKFGHLLLTCTIFINYFHTQQIKI
jgi:hypothetical protein